MKILSLFILLQNERVEKVPEGVQDRKTIYNIFSKIVSL